MTKPTTPEQAKYIASHLLTHDATASLALRSLADQVEELQLALETERAAANLYAKQVAHWIEKHDALLAQQLEVAESRDAYAEAADTMYAAHKVERDALKDAARLAQDALYAYEPCIKKFGLLFGTGNKAIAALKAVL